MGSPKIREAPTSPAPAGRGVVTIHFAGHPVRVGSRCRQRCAWCGFVIEDLDLRDVMVPSRADGSPGEGPTPWTSGALVAVSRDGSFRSVVAHEDGAPLPSETCFDEANDADTKLASLSIAVEDVLDDLIEVGNGMVLDDAWRQATIDKLFRARDEPRASVDEAREKGRRFMRGGGRGVS